jgi:hypothetical protein
MADMHLPSRAKMPPSHAAPAEPQIPELAAVLFDKLPLISAVGQASKQPSRGQSHALISNTTRPSTSAAFAKLSLDTNTLHANAVSIHVHDMLTSGAYTPCKHVATQLCISTQYKN